MPSTLPWEARWLRVVVPPRLAGEALEGLRLASPTAERPHHDGDRGSLGLIGPCLMAGDKLSFAPLLGEGIHA
jgi:hypothetical protein